MSKAEAEYQKLVEALSSGEKTVAGQMFGKPCLKVGGKAFCAQHKDAVVFKLGAPAHAKAMSFTGAGLWDPSGKGRPMKEWVAIPAAAATARQLAGLAKVAQAYVESAA